MQLAGPAPPPGGRAPEAVDARSGLRGRGESEVEPSAPEAGDEHLKLVAEVLRHRREASREK